MIMKVIFLDEAARSSVTHPVSADDQARDPVAVKREGHIALAVETVAGHGDVGMVDAVALCDANDAKIGLDADIVRLVPPRNPVAAVEITAPVAQKGIVGEGSQKGFAITGVGGFDKAADRIRCGH
ncbi:hypothetical protein MPLDJ20_60328 [Mesorhizobium plurifarium]|uniref:Uncharacterized protein n=1 Tax=Mesorhizobium plurifarium TaxID=69974 RepID=A0A090FIJ1_MESPL|nr:hypothetical protein MPLDJ20_60328 [Mesorhizobium plurifarium]